MKPIPKLLVIIILSFVLMQSCTKSDTDSPINTDLPTLTTTLPSSIGTATASCGGTVITDGGTLVTARGVVWSTMPNPTIALATKTIDGTGTGVFTSMLSGLNPSITYYIKAYATNSTGTSYGNELSFSTTLTDALTLTTTLPSSIGTATASCGGTVITDGGTLVTARGVVWSTMPNPTIALATKTTNGTGTGMFTSVISGLNPSTTYYVKAYATNSTGTSYGNELSFATLQNSSTTVTDVDGNTYPLVTICAQVWTTKNLAVTAYSDGTVIPQVTDPTAWANLTTGAWCYYNNSSGSGATYGKLYNWYAAAGIYNAASLANPTLRKKLAPTGYHVPTDAEWITLTTCLGGENVAGGKMKEIGTAHWETPNQDATNSSGFLGLPGGARNNTDGTFGSLGYVGLCWSSTQDDTTYAWSRNLNYNYGSAYRENYNKIAGFSVRCLRD